MNRIAAGLVLMVGLESALFAQHSLQVAEGLQAKIEVMKKAEMEQVAGTRKRLEAAPVSEIELESYVLFLLKDKIPARLDSVDFQLVSDVMTLSTQVTFDNNSTGYSALDWMVRGKHSLVVKGKLVGFNSKAQFDLESVRVDGVPVPTTLVEFLFNRYVKPIYPIAEVGKPFALPFGIDMVTLQPQKATVVY